MQVHTPQDKCSIDNYSRRSLALLIPSSRLNARNSPGSRPYCNYQLLKKFLQIVRNHENLTTQKFFMQIIFNMKISRSTVHSVWIQYLPAIHTAPQPEPGGVSVASQPVLKENEERTKDNRLLQFESAGFLSALWSRGDKMRLYELLGGKYVSTCKACGKLGGSGSMLPWEILVLDFY